MTNSEKDYTAMMKQDETPKEKNIPTNLRQRFNITAKNEAVVTPLVTLPITDDVETNAAGDEIDTSNNYTAAENDHNTNATL